MPRKRSALVNQVQPPRFPAELPVIPAPSSLDDHASYSEVTLLDADLTGTEASDILLEQVVWRRARLTQGTFTLAQFTDVQFDTCDLAGATLTKAQLNRVALVGCRLLGMALLDARLDDVLVQRGNAEALRCWNTTLRGVRFERCMLRAASFTGSNLSGVVFRDCDLSAADLRDTTLRGADLRGSTLTGLQVNLRDLQGVIVAPLQAAELAALLGLDVRTDDPSDALG